MTSSDRCPAVPVPGLVEIKPFSHAPQPLYYNQAQCVPLYGHYPRQYDHIADVTLSGRWQRVAKKMGRM